MEDLTIEEVNNAKETVLTVTTGSKTYYIDLLQDGKYGVSKDEKPLNKFQTLDQARLYIKSI